MPRQRKKVDIYHPTPDEALDFMRAVLLHSHCDFTHEWQGWKLRGRDLVSPDGDRISARRLRGLMFAETNRVRAVRARPQEVGNVVPLQQVR